MPDLGAGEAGVAIRYSRLPPGDGADGELGGDTFEVVSTLAFAGVVPRPMPPVRLVRYPSIGA